MNMLIDVMLSTIPIIILATFFNVLAYKLDKSWFGMVVIVMIVLAIRLYQITSSYITLDTNPIDRALLFTVPLVMPIVGLIGFVLKFKENYKLKSINKYNNLKGEKLKWHR